MAGPVRKTKVNRQPYWVPTDNDGKGSWRWLPNDTAHTATITTPGEGAPMPLYMAKGYLPKTMAPPEALKVLPKYEALHAARDSGDVATAKKLAAEIRGVAA